MAWKANLKRIREQTYHNCNPRLVLTTVRCVLLYLFLSVFQRIVGIPQSPKIVFVSMITLRTFEILWLLWSPQMDPAASRRCVGLSSVPLGGATLNYSMRKCSFTRFRQAATSKQRHWIQWMWYVAGMRPGAEFQSVMSNYNKHSFWFQILPLSAPNKLNISAISAYHKKQCF